MRKLLLLLLLSFPLAAQPVITGLSAISGPIAGGNEVRINGRGFSICIICSPPLPLPVVYFGGAPATIVSGNDTTMVVIVPAHLPGTFDVVVEQSDGTFVAQDAYTYAGGNVDDVFERVLLPLLTPPVHGAFGSEFHTALRLSNRNETKVAVFGVQPACNTISGCILFDPLERPYVINQFSAPRDFQLDGTPGRFVYIEKKLAPKVFANLRVFDVTRSAENFGTEIPVVRDDEFVRGPIRLLGIPLDPRFRNTLRIYMHGSSTVIVTIGDEEHMLTPAQPENPFEPAYLQFTDFPTGTGTIDIEIAEPEIVVLPAVGPNPIWAFVSVTNNDTQLITTITPQPLRTDPAGFGSN